MNENQIYVERYVLPLDTLMEMVEVAPKASPVTGIDARELVRVLDLHTNSQRGVSGADGVPYWTMSVKDAVEAYKKLSGAEDVSPSQVGRLLGALGLGKHRTKTGYLVLWNRAQVDILKRHFTL